MKKIIWLTPDKMLFESPFKIFNEQTNVIVTGNMIANTQFSWDIRPFNETANGSFCFEPGILREFDLGAFRNYGVPEYILKEVRSHTQDEGAWLYVFFHYSAYAKRRIIDGVVLTGKDGRHIKTWQVNQDWRAREAVYEATKYIILEKDTGKEQ